MRYNQLGRSGLQVSELSFGTWLTFGNHIDDRTAELLCKTAFEHGVNFFDCAETYARGRAEESLGRVIKRFRREEIVVSTKIFWGGEDANQAVRSNQTGLSWKRMVEGTKNSLRRLSLEYVDLLFCHRPDSKTPVEETVRAISTLIAQGLVFYWGTSEWPAERLSAAFDAASRANCPAPVMEQPQYNLLVRQRVEKEYLPLYEQHGLGLTTWSPLASGILTGKYQKGIPAGSRLHKEDWLKERRTAEWVAAVEKLSAIAKRLGCTTGQLAIAWCLKNPNVSTVILGASSLEQLEENIHSLRWKESFTPEILREIDAACPLPKPA